MCHFCAYRTISLMAEPTFTHIHMGKESFGSASSNHEVRRPLAELVKYQLRPKLNDAAHSRAAVSTNARDGNLVR